MPDLDFESRFVSDSPGGEDIFASRFKPEPVVPSYPRAAWTGFKQGLASIPALYESAGKLISEPLGVERAFIPLPRFMESWFGGQAPVTAAIKALRPSPEEEENVQALGIPGEIVRSAAAVPGTVAKYTPIVNPAMLAGPVAGAAITGAIEGGAEGGWGGAGKEAAKQAALFKILGLMGPKLGEAPLGMGQEVLRQGLTRPAKAAATGGLFGAEALGEQLIQGVPLPEALRGSIAPTFVGAGLGALHGRLPYPKGTRIPYRDIPGGIQAGAYADPAERPGMEGLTEPLGPSPFFPPVPSPFMPPSITRGDMWGPGPEPLGLPPGRAQIPWARAGRVGEGFEILPGEEEAIRRSGPPGPPPAGREYTVLPNGDVVPSNRVLRYPGIATGEWPLEGDQYTIRPNQPPIPQFPEEARLGTGLPFERTQLGRAAEGIPFGTEEPGPQQSLLVKPKPRRLFLGAELKRDRLVKEFDEGIKRFEGKTDIANGVADIYWELRAGLPKEQMGDLVDIIRKMGGLNRGDPNIDATALSAKESGAKTKGSIFREGQRRNIDEMREEILDEAGLNPNTTTDELVRMIEDAFGKKLETKPVKVAYLTKKGVWKERLEREPTPEERMKAIEKGLIKGREKLGDREKRIFDEAWEESVRRATEGKTEREANEAEYQRLLAEEVVQRADALRELADERAALQAPESDLPDADFDPRVLLDLIQKDDRLSLREKNRQLNLFEEREGLLKKAEVTPEDRAKYEAINNELVTTRKPELSATAKDQYALPGIKAGLKMAEEGRAVKPTLEGTPLAEAAKKAEVAKEPTLFPEKGDFAGFKILSEEEAKGLIKGDFPDVVASLKEKIGTRASTDFEIEVSPKPLDPTLEEAIKLFGREVVMVRTTKGELPVNGWLSTVDGRIYINEGTKRPLLAVFGHELTHAFETGDPALFNKLFKFVRTKQGLSFKEEYPEGERRSELIADYVGERMVNPSFWHALSQKEPELFSRIASKVLEWIMKIKDQLFSRRAPQGAFEDINAIEKATRDAITEFAKKNKVYGDKLMEQMMAEDPIWYQGQKVGTKFGETASGFFTKDLAYAEDYAAGLSAKAGEEKSGGRVVAVRESELKRVGAKFIGNEATTPVLGNPQVNIESVVKKDIPAFKKKMGQDLKPVPESQDLLDLKDRIADIGRQFAEQDVAPGALKLKGGFQDTLKSIKNILVPRAGVTRAILDTIMNKKGTQERLLSEFILDKVNQDAKAQFNKMTPQDLTTFIDNVKTGQPQATPQLDQMAQLIRTLDQEIGERYWVYRPNMEWLQNHFRVLWKEIPRGSEALIREIEGEIRSLRGKPASQERTEQIGVLEAQVDWIRNGVNEPGNEGWRNWWSKRPMEGSRGYFKQHTLEDMSEGIKFGGVPWTYNPMEMLEMHYNDALKFITAQEMWKGLKDIGARTFVRAGQLPPNGFVKLDDRIARVFYPIKGEANKPPFGAQGPTAPGKKLGMVQAGEWYVEEGAGRLLNNYLSRDLIREKPLWAGLMGLKNMSTAMELALSPFHFVFETIEATASAAGLGMRKMANQGQIAEGIKDILKAPAAGYEYAKTGGQAIKWISDPNSLAGIEFARKFPGATDLIADLFVGGAKLGLHEDYRINGIKALRENLNSNNYIGAALRSIPALNEMMMKPLFETYIPRLKIGMFLKEYSNELVARAQELQNGTTTRPEVARQVWDFVENRLGEMNFDNLFWDRTFKSSLQLLVRSVTWKLGNIRAFGKAVSGQSAEMLAALKEGRAPKLTPEMAWTWGVMATTAALASVVQYAFTGKQPEEMKDLVYPKINEQGDRVSLPTYLRDSFHLVHAPGKYVWSSLSGWIGRLEDVLTNKDFYGTQIHDPEQNVIMQRVDDLIHMTPLPFSVQSFKQMREQGQPGFRQITGFLGATKAPYWIEKSPAQQLATELSAAMIPAGGMTKEDRAKTDLIKRYAKDYNAGKTEEVMASLREEFRAGKITGRDITRFRNRITHEPLEQSIMRLTLSDALRVWEKATHEEKAKIAPIVLGKFRRSQSMEEKQKALPQIQQMVGGIQ